MQKPILTKGELMKIVTHVAETGNPTNCDRFLYQLLSQTDEAAQQTLTDARHIFNVLHLHELAQVSPVSEAPKKRGRKAKDNTLSIA